MKANVIQTENIHNLTLVLRSSIIELCSKLWGFSGAVSIVFSVLWNSWPAISKGESIVSCVFFFLLLRLNPKGSISVKSCLKTATKWANPLCVSICRPAWCQKHWTVRETARRTTVWTQQEVPTHPLPGQTWTSCGPDACSSSLPCSSLQPSVRHHQSLTPPYARSISS